MSPGGFLQHVGAAMGALKTVPRPSAGGEGRRRRAASNGRLAEEGSRGWVMRKFFGARWSEYSQCSCRWHVCCQSFRTLSLLLAPALLLLSGCESGGQAESGPKKKYAGDDAAIVKEARKGPVHMRVELTPGHPRLSDTIRLSIELTADPAVELHPPLFGKAVAGFTILGYREAKPELRNGQTVRR